MRSHPYALFSRTHVYSKISSTFGTPNLYFALRLSDQIIAFITYSPHAYACFINIIPLELVALIISVEDNKLWISLLCP
jgi:hypothetical protein